jgi:hypothetical protein
LTLVAKGSFLLFFAGGGEDEGGKLRSFTCPSGRGELDLDLDDILLHERFLDAVDSGKVYIVATEDLT